MDKPLILIIDDDDNLRKTLADILRVKGYEPLTAKYGTEGLALLRNTRQEEVQVALIDLKLPDISGLDVLHRVRSNHPGVESIILTGNASLESAIEATNKGAFSYIQKPCDIDQLLLHIRHAVEKRESAKKIQEYQEHLEDLVRERTKELEAAKDAAEAGSRAKTEFIANMGHEVRTPLNAVIGFSEVLLDGLSGALNVKQKEYTANILESGKNLRDLILSVLAFSEAESGRMELQATRFPLKDVLGSSTAIVREQAMQKKITLTLALDPDADIELEADYGKFSQIMFHLLSNALKFTPEGGSVHVTARRVQRSEFKVQSETKGSELKTKNSELDRDYMEITVEDTGIGIKPEDMPRLFKEFTQLEAPITKQYKGTGIGLTLAKRMIELHGGRIGVNSEFGKGSKFTFVLPVEQRMDVCQRTTA